MAAIIRHGLSIMSVLVLVHELYPAKALKCVTSVALLTTVALSLCRSLPLWTVKLVNLRTRDLIDPKCSVRTSFG